MDLEHIGIKVPAESKNRYQKAAKKEKMTLSEWIRKWADYGLKTPGDKVDVWTDIPEEVRDHIDKISEQLVGVSTGRVVAKQVLLSEAFLVALTDVSEAAAMERWFGITEFMSIRTLTPSEKHSVQTVFEECVSIFRRRLDPLKRSYAICQELAKRRGDDPEFDKILTEVEKAVPKPEGGPIPKIFESKTANK